MEHDDLVSQALTLAWTTKGVSEYGIRYLIEGARCSGDAHTSIGNGLINAFATFVALYDIKPSEWVSVHEGDDGVVGLRNGVLQQAVDGFSILGPLGFNIKLAVFDQIDDVSFCGRHFYTDMGSLCEHADIMRSLDKMHTSASGCRADVLLLAKMLSYYYTDRNTPLIGPLTYSIIGALKKRNFSFSARKRAFHSIKMERWLLREEDTSCELMEIKPPEISTAARVSCMRRTGMPMSMQLRLERHYMQCFHMGEILYLPKITREWFSRPDGYIFGDPRLWVR